MTINTHDPTDRPDNELADNRPIEQSKFIRKVNEQDESSLSEEFYDMAQSDMQTDSKPAMGEGLSEFDYDEQMVDYQSGESVSPAKKNKKSHDQLIKEKAFDLLKKETDLDFSDINIAVNQGTIVLSGSVPSRDEKIRAELAIESINGVEDIVNNLRLRKMSEN